MIDYTDPHFREEEVLIKRWLSDSEGLSEDEYFDKYASDEYKQYIVELNREIAELEAQGCFV